MKKLLTLSLIFTGVSLMAYSRPEEVSDMAMYNLSGAVNALQVATQKAQNARGPEAKMFVAQALKALRSAEMIHQRLEAMHLRVMSDRGITGTPASLEMLKGSNLEFTAKQLRAARLNIAAAKSVLERLAARTGGISLGDF